MFTYRHDAATPPGTGPGGFIVGTCVIGGGFYPDSGPFPATWRGGYFFADLGGIAEFVAFVDLKNDNAVYAFGSSGPRPVGLLVANDGAVLVLTQQDGIVRFTAPYERSKAGEIELACRREVGAVPGAVLRMCPAYHLRQG